MKVPRLHLEEVKFASKKIESINNSDTLRTKSFDKEVENNTFKQKLKFQITTLEFVKRNS